MTTKTTKTTMDNTPITKAKPSIKAEFDAKVAAGATPDELKEWLINHGVPFSKVPKVYRELGGPAGKRQGFRSQFYGWLREDTRGMDDVKAYIDEYGSENDKRHLTHYQGIAELANAIHNSK